MLTNRGNLYAVNALNFTPMSRPAQLTPKSYVLAFDFVSPGEGWALILMDMAEKGVANQVALMHTVDGGASWERLPLSVDPSSTQAWDRSFKDEVAFMNGQRGWIRARGRIFETLVFVTEDGGRSWKIEFAPSNALTIHTPHGIATLPAAGGLADVAEGRAKWLYGGPDATQSWDRPRPVPAVEQSVRTGWTGFLDAKNWWVMERQSVSTSSDGGVSWIEHQAKLPSGFDFHLMDFVTPAQGWAVIDHQTPVYKGYQDDCRLYMTGDGGRTWSQSSLPPPPAR